MTIQALIVGVLLAAILVPVIRAELARRSARKPVLKQPRPAKRETVAKTPLRLVVSKSDMDRELAALLAKDSRKSNERED
jgi:hypothetical protein